MSTTERPIEPIPTNADCGLRFRCARQRAVLTGRACALAWLKVNATAKRRTEPDGSARMKVKLATSPCNGCAAGQARAAQLASWACVSPPPGRRERIVEVPLDTVGIVPPPPMTPEREAARDPKAIPIPRRTARTRADGY